MAGEGALDLVGRNAQIGSIAAARERAASTAQIVVVEGEAGMGKSRLLTAEIERASLGGFRVYSGRHEGPDSHDALGPILRALEISDGSPDVHRRAVIDALRPALTPATPSLLSATTPANQDAVVQGIADVVAQVAAVGKTLVVVDDVHWGTSATFIALRAIVEACADLPLLVLVATRPPVTRDTIQGIATLERVGAGHLTLDPLSAEEVIELARATLDATPGPRLSADLARTGGNPLLVVELVRALTRVGAITIHDGVAESTSGASSPTLGANVLGTLDDLSDGARGVLRLAALLRERFTVSELATVAGRPAAHLVDHIDEALRSGLLVEVDAQLAFQHDLIRAVIYESVPAAVRRGIHRQIAESLVTAGAPLTKIASNFALGADEGDEEAAAWLQRAARGIIGHDPSGAANLLARAEEIVGPSSPQRSALLAERLDALILASRLEEADVLSRDLVHLQSDPQALIAVQRRRAVVLLLQNMAAEATDILEAVSEAEGTPTETLAEAALAALCAGDLHRGEVSARRIQSAPERANASARSLALSILSRAASMELDLEGSLALARAGVAIADADPTGEAHRYQPLIFEGFSLHDLDRLEETATLMDTALRVAHERGLGFAAPLLRGLLAFTHWRAGRLDGVVAEAEASIRRGDELQMRLADAWCFGLLALVALHRDELAVAEDALAGVDRSLSANAPLLGFDLAALAQARVAEAGGDPSGALDQLLSTWELLEATDAYMMMAVIAPDAVRIGVSLGQHARVERVVTEIERAAKFIDLPSWRGAALVARGRLNDDLDDLVRGAGLLQASPRHLDAADALEAAGVAALGKEDRRHAQALLTEAIAIYDSAGARRDRARVAAALRTAGGKVPRAPVTVEAGGREVLSPAEREVTRLVLAGLSNPEIAERLFVSRRTVESHLRRIFTKLGVSSRVELAVWANDNRSRRATTSRHPTS